MATDFDGIAELVDPEHLGNLLATDFDGIAELVDPEHLGEPLGH